MSTELKSTLTARAIRIDGPRDGWADSVEIAGIMLDRADFLKAVADELDVIVVERSELPEVEPRDPKRGYNVGAVRMLDGSDYDAAECRATGLRWLALAEYLDANPPVDEAQVAALAELYESAVDDSGVGAHEVHPVEIARRLVEKGVRVEVTP